MKEARAAGPKRTSGCTTVQPARPALRYLARQLAGQFPCLPCLRACHLTNTGTRVVSTAWMALCPGGGQAHKTPPSPAGSRSAAASRSSERSSKKQARRCSAPGTSSWPDSGHWNLKIACAGGSRQARRCRFWIRAAGRWGGISRERGSGSTAWDLAGCVLAEQLHQRVALAPWTRARTTLCRPSGPLGSSRRREQGQLDQLQAMGCELAGLSTVKLPNVP